MFELASLIHQRDLLAECAKTLDKLESSPEVERLKRLVAELQSIAVARAIEIEGIIGGTNMMGDKN